MRIGIIGAMHEEIIELKEAMTEIKEVVIKNLTFFEGKLHSKDVVLVQSGIGKVNAAIATTLLISNFNIDKIIFTGVAGAVNNDISVTDIVIGTDLIESDMDVTAGGNYKLGDIPGMKNSIFKADPYLFTLAESVAIKLFGKNKIHTGRIISRDEFVASTEKVNKLREIFNAECVEMEGAAVAHVCEIMNVPFVIIRSISDKADNEAGLSFDEFVKIAAKNSKLIVEGILSILK